MNTKILMAASALVMFVAGAAALFAPHELLAALGAPATGVLPSLLQLHAAVLLGFAMTNWMARESAIGGIYNRPLLIGNVMHFAAGALTLLRLVAANRAVAVIVLTIVYAMFAIGFGMLMFRSPVATQR